MVIAKKKTPTATTTKAIVSPRKLKINCQTTKNKILLPQKKTQSQKKLTNQQMTLLKNPLRKKTRSQQLMTLKSLTEKKLKAPRKKENVSLKTRRLQRKPSTNQQLNLWQRCKAKTIWLTKLQLSLSRSADHPKNNLNRQRSRVLQEVDLLKSKTLPPNLSKNQHASQPPKLVPRRAL